MTTKFRTDLVNTIGGVFPALAFLAFFLPKVDYSKGFWSDTFPQVGMIAFGTAISGFVFAFLINRAQGANHQSGASSNAEEKRSGKASIVVAGLICLVLPFIQFKDSTVLWVLAAITFCVAGFLWKIYPKWFKDTK